MLMNFAFMEVKEACQLEESKVCQCGQLTLEGGLVSVVVELGES